MKQMTLANTISLMAIAVTAYLLLRKKSAPGPSSAETPSTTTSAPNPSGITRGLRNNNPLNIEYKAGTNWQGEIIPSGDSRFAQFQTMEYGIRAAFKTLDTYVNKYGITSLEKIIKRWDPGSTNYVNVVCQLTGYAPNKDMSKATDIEWIKLVRAMSQMENGVSLSLMQTKQGWDLYKNA